VLESSPLPDLPQQSAAPPRVHVSERFVAAFEVFLISGIPTQILLIATIAALGMPMRTDEGTMSPPFVFAVSLLDAVVVLSLVALLLHSRRESIHDVLIGHGRILREVMVGIVLIPFVFFVVIAIMAIVLTYAPSLRNVPHNPLEDLIRSRSDAMIFAIVVMLAGGVREEVQRGFIVHRFEGFLGGGLTGVIVYSLPFGLGHFEQGWDATVTTGFLGLIWGLVYLRRRSIIAPMVSHAGFNLAQVVKTVVLR
jgi:membrane protease YdiL (CAAX protease family)